MFRPNVGVFQVRFSSLLVPRFGASALSFYDTVSQLTNGRSFVFPLPAETGPNRNDIVGAGTYHQMIEAFYALRRLDTDSASNVPVTVRIF